MTDESNIENEICNNVAKAVNEVKLLQCSHTVLNSDKSAHLT